MFRESHPRAKMAYWNHPPKAQSLKELIAFLFSLRTQLYLSTTVTVAHDGRNARHGYKRKKRQLTRFETGFF